MAAGFVASNIGKGTASTRALTLTLTSGQAVAFGVIWESTATFSSVASSLGNTYTLRGTEQTLGASKMRVYTADNVSGGSETITVTFSASNYSVILGMNVNGVSTAAYDGLGGPTTDTSSPWTSATVSPSIPDAILVSFVTNDSANVGTWTAGNGFTKGAEDGDGSTSWSVSQAYKVVATTAADNGSWTCTQGTNAIVWTLAFKGISAGPTITVQPTQQSAVSGSTATFSVTATSSGGSLSYLWYKNGVTTGTTTASYTTPTLANADNGNTYYCAVTDSNGTTNTATVYLFIIGESSGDGDKINSAWFFR